MSLIGEKDHRETIYQILYTEPPRRPKSPMYISEKEKQLKRLHSSKPKTHATMGYADVPLKTSEEFLKKGEGIHVYSKEQKKCCLISNKLPSLPKPDPNYNKSKNEKQNFERRNVKNVKEMPVSGLKQPAHVVDSPDGHTSGVYKFKWVHTKSFGNVPRYLAKRNEMINHMEKEYRKQLENEDTLCKPISPDERQKLLDGLKQNWAELQKEFLLLPMLIDTVPKVIRKTKLESKLKELEKNLRMVEENPYIYVHD